MAADWRFRRKPRARVSRLVWACAACFFSRLPSLGPGQLSAGCGGAGASSVPPARRFRLACGAALLICLNRFARRGSAAPEVGASSAGRADKVGQLARAAGNFCASLARVVDLTLWGACPALWLRPLPLALLSLGYKLALLLYLCSAARTGTRRKMNEQLQWDTLPARVREFARRPAGRPKAKRATFNF